MITTDNARYSALGINPLNAELNPICHLLALLGSHYILHVSRVRVKFHIAAEWLNSDGKTASCTVPVRSLPS
jgi:hypothetical protein